MQNQILRGVQLGNATIQNDDIRIDVRCDFSESIREEMKWDAPGLKTQMLTFDDEFGIGRFILAADQKMTDGTHPEIVVPFDSASGFRVIRVTEKGKDSTYLQLRFHVCTTAPGIAQLCSDYKRAVKKSRGQMRLRIGKEPEAGDAPLFEEQFIDDKGEQIPNPRISNIEGMEAGKRRGRPPGAKNKTQRAQIIAAVAAEEPTVTVDDDLEDSAGEVMRIIDHSLEGVEYDDPEAAEVL